MQRCNWSQVTVEVATFLCPWLGLTTCGCNVSHIPGWSTYLHLFTLSCSYLHWFALICTYLHLFALICSYLHWFAFICTYLHLFALYVVNFGTTLHLPRAKQSKGRSAVQTLILARSQSSSVAMRAFCLHLLVTFVSALHTGGAMQQVKQFQAGFGRGREGLEGAGPLSGKSNPWNCWSDPFWSCLPRLSWFLLQIHWAPRRTYFSPVPGLSAPVLVFVRITTSNLMTLFVSTPDTVVCKRLGSEEKHSEGTHWHGIHPADWLAIRNHKACLIVFLGKSIQSLVKPLQCIESVSIHIEILIQQTKVSALQCRSKR